MTDKDPAREAAERIASECGYCLTADAAEEILRHAFADALEDVKRLDWLDRHFELRPDPSLPSQFVWLLRWPKFEPQQPLRAAIDAAREGGEDG
jgi:hypothetical protein